MDGCVDCTWEGFIALMWEINVSLSSGEERLPQSIEGHVIHIPAPPRPEKQ